jgi:hypothetical protein
MFVGHAKGIARQWVLEEGRDTPGFYGAFFHGSVNWLSDDATLPTTSDVDVMVVLTDSAPPNKLGKFLYRGVLLEVSYLPRAQVQYAEQVLGQYQIAGSFSVPSVILDPSGELTELQEAVSREYARLPWVRKRCEHARNNVLNFLNGLNESALFHDQVAPWLFGTGVTTHILLVAGLKNPTVRTRYLAERELLVDYGRLPFYETLLEMLGCARMRRGQAEEHLVALAGAFDAAKIAIRTPYRFAADLTDLARPVAIDGSRDLIERGDHREAIFWMVATYSRCQWVLQHDAPQDVQEKYSVGYRELLADLGITSFADLQRRGEQVRDALPRIWEVAEAIMAANPAIETES